MKSDKDQVTGMGGLVGTQEDTYYASTSKGV